MNFPAFLLDRAPLSAVGRDQRRGMYLHVADKKESAIWRDALILSIGVWAFMMLSFLPLMIERHAGGHWTSLLLDYSTVVTALCFSMGLFGLFRMTVDWAMTPRALVLGTGIVAAAFGQSVIDHLFSAWVAEELISAWQAIPQGLQRTYEAIFNYICVFGFNVGLFQFAFSRRRSVAHERQMGETRGEAQKAQLAALRFQLSPHFLFNTLNSISALIVTRRNEDAEEMTEKLASFLRTSLTFEPAELVPLEEELALAEDYLDIESVRFGDRLQVEIGCAPEAGTRLVPPFIVQPLVENAVKHGVAAARVPVTIAIDAHVEGDVLTIAIANGRDPADAESRGGTGVGLANVRRRLEAIYGPAGTLTTEKKPDSFVATIRIAASFDTPPLQGQPGQAPR